MRDKYGAGVPENNIEAVKWYRLAAEQGYAEAQFNLGVMYKNGEGVIKDYVKAYIFLSVAGVQGFSIARDKANQLEKKMTPEQIERGHTL